MRNTDRHVFAALSEFSLRYLTRSFGYHFTTLRALNASHARFTIGRIGTFVFFILSFFHRFSFASQCTVGQKMKYDHEIRTYGSSRPRQDGTETEKRDFNRFI